MVWFYSRGKEALRLETRFDTTSREYVLELVWPGRSPEIERFENLETFRARVLILEQQLEADRWEQVGSPTILPHGWRGPISH